MKRLPLISLLLGAALLVGVFLDAPVARVEAERAVSPAIPREALEAMERGRYLRASLILREYLATQRDTAADAALLAAQAEAGWADWDGVERLLRGKTWLDSAAGGIGWSLIGRAQLELGRHAEARQSLERFLEVAGDAGDRERGLATVRLADASRGLEQYADAADAYERAAALLPRIADWLRYDAASAAAGAGDTAAVRRAIASLPANLANDWAWRLPVTARRAAEDATGAASLAESIAGGSGSAARRAEAWSIAGQLRLLLGDTAAARQAFRSAMRLGPGTGAAVDAARNLGDLPGLTVDDQLEIGRIYLRHGNIARASAGIGAYLDANAGSVAERARLRYELGRGLFNAGRYADAERLLLAVVRDATQPSMAAEALFLVGRSQYRDGRQEMGRGTFLRVAQEYRGQPAATRAMYFSADLDHDDGNVARAAERYRETISLGTDIEEVGLAHMRLAGMAFADGDYRTALTRFENYRNRYPQGRRWAQSTYWAALAKERLGDHQGARALLQEVRRREPFSYYGGRAAERLEADFWSMPLAQAPSRDPQRADAIARPLARIDLLRELERHAAADYEVGRARREAGSDAAQYELAEALNERGMTTTGISLGWDLYRRSGSWNPRLLRIVYPFPYRDIIVEEAREHGVDPFLAAGLIRQESMFNARAVSPAGAIGLMQVMPETGRILVRSLDVAQFTNELLKKPELNVTLGMRYLADQLTAYDGRLPLVLSAYNAGPTRVTRWERLFPEFADDELFSERIPFAETREYVKIVQQNGRIYRALWGDVGMNGGG